MKKNHRNLKAIKKWGQIIIDKDKIYLSEFKFDVSSGDVISLMHEAKVGIISDAMERLVVELFNIKKEEIE